MAASPEYHCQLVLVTNETAVFQAPSAGSAGEAERERQVLLQPAEAEEARMPTSEKPSTDIAYVRQCWSASGSTRSTRYDARSTARWRGEV